MASLAIADHARGRKPDGGVRDQSPECAAAQTETCAVDPGIRSRRRTYGHACIGSPRLHRIKGIRENSDRIVTLNFDKRAATGPQHF